MMASIGESLDGLESHELYQAWRWIDRLERRNVISVVGATCWKAEIVGRIVAGALDSERRADRDRHARAS